MDFRVVVKGLVSTESVLTIEDFHQCKTQVDVQKIAPTFSGTGVPFSEIAEKIGPKPEATHVIFHAADEFAATIPISELQEAIFLYKSNGEPLKKGFPVRLIVPDGSSDCLNVKSVVKVEFVAADPADPASFGFKNLVGETEL
ncbi:molybdopterin-dependent oxidoreductase [Effusibacillus consociatus]|uniref:Molybdopterin-dependent oxidoreductase n=1 Tax=Effusibacillus consociatus TaxID=1117041 RepID=A0ABV9Q4C6_9BACL